MVHNGARRTKYNTVVSKLHKRKRDFHTFFRLSDFILLLRSQGDLGKKESSTKLKKMFVSAFLFLIRRRLAQGITLFIKAIVTTRAGIAKSKIFAAKFSFVCSYFTEILSPIV